MPTPAQAAAAGFEVSDYERDPVELWPENWALFKVFERIRTQWIVGPGGPIGLNYLAAYPLLDHMHPPASDAWLAALDDIRDMEAAALHEIHDRIR